MGRPGPRSTGPITLPSPTARNRSLSVSGWGAAWCALLGAPLATVAWLVGLFGLVWGLPVLVLLAAAVLAGTAVAVARITGRGLLTVIVVIVAPSLVLFLLVVLR